MNFFINTQNFAKIGIMTITIDIVINIILAPLFILRKRSTLKLFFKTCGCGAVQFWT